MRSDGFDNIEHMSIYIEFELCVSACTVALGAKGLS